MPAVVAVTPAGSHTAPAIVPPAAALQAPMRILKRPSPNPSSSSSSSSMLDQRQSLAEREARYQAARDRIFGQDANGDASNCPPKGKPAILGSNAVRNPRGPGEDQLENGGVAKGFNGRRK